MSVIPAKAMIGMVHVGALPGTPHGTRAVRELAARAVEEARVLAKAGFDAIILENMHDRPYVQGAKPPEIVAAMTVVGAAVRAAVKEMPLGVQILSGGNKEAIAVAHAIGAQFIRCENFVFSHIADEGLVEKAEAGELLRYRRSIGAQSVLVFTDIKKKHASHAITADITLTDSAEAAEFFSADGVIITGTATGKPTSPADVAEAKAATNLPVWVGSGVTADQVAALFEHADALIVGTAIKRGGKWENPVEAARCVKMMQAARGVRRKATRRGLS